MVLGISMGARRRRERAEVAHVARRRLELLEAELAGIRPRARPVLASPPRAGSGEAPVVPRGAGRHAARSTPVPAGPPGDLAEPDLEPWRVVPPLVGPAPVAAPTPVRSATRVLVPEPSHDETGHLTRLGAALALAPRVDPVGDDPLGPGRPPLRVVGPASTVAPELIGSDDRGGRLQALGSWLEDRLPATLQGRVRLSGPGVAVLVSGLALALLAVTWMTIRSTGGQEVPATEVSRVAALSTSPTARATRQAGTGVPSGASAVVVVDVAGKVRHPGIVTLPAGSRVHEALARAGGARAGVDLTGLNLARVLVDGEQIVVGRKAVAASGPDASAAGSGAGAPLVDLNTATAEQLDTLPGVGEVTARKILEWRAAHGTFTSVDELLEVDGIGEKTLADIKPHATV